MTGIEHWLLPKLGMKRPPWTLHRTQPTTSGCAGGGRVPPIAYPKPDGKLTFDRLSSVFISNTNHEENQPAHLTLKDASVPVAVNLALRRPESRYCPAGVYEYVPDEGRRRPPADQRAELRALQDLRHQGPDAEHRLGHARGRRRAELRGDVRLHGGPVQALARPRPVACRSRGRPAASMHEALLDHGWDVAAQGLPCNQLELAYTLLTFGYVFARGMRTLRIGLPPEDEHALLHTWNVVGHLVGIGRGAMVEDMAAAEALFGRIQALGLRHPPSPDPRPPLARALMRTMAAVIPWRIARPMPVLLTRLLCGKAARSELGLNQQVGWPARALFALGLGLVRAVDAIGRTIRPDFSVARLVTRLVGVRLLSRLLMDQTRPLNLPTGLLPQLGRTVAGWREDARAPRWMRALEGRLSSPASWVAR
jgi:hypothetical protein